MGTLKCVCSYLSRDIRPNQLEHTLLRVPIDFLIVYLSFLNKFGPAQNILGLGPVKGQGINEQSKIKPHSTIDESNCYMKMTE